MNYLDLAFHCRLLTDATFSARKGSMLRGALGASLRRGMCMTRRSDCGACMLAKNCVFPRVFKPLPAGSLPAPPPFCLAPDADERRDYKAGETFSFGMKLFSYATEYLPFFVQAFRAAGERGVGSANPEGKFELAKVEWLGRSLYDKDADRLDIPEPQNAPLPAINKDENETGRITVRLLSPLRHKADNHFSAKLEFLDLFHLVLRRIKALSSLDGLAYRLDQDLYRSLRAKAEQTRIIEDNSRWKDWKRYSSRQDAIMNFGGLIGDITYEGPVSPFREFLAFAEIAHIGKQTSFGLGRVKAED